MMTGKMVDIKILKVLVMKLGRRGAQSFEKAGIDSSTQRGKR
jgi:hypothetical protein